MSKSFQPPVSTRLSDLLGPWVRVPSAQDAALTGMRLASGELDAGNLFAALSGTRRHGLEFLEDALGRGAAAVIAAPAPAQLTSAAEQLCRERGVPLIWLQDLNAQVSAIAGRLYGQPSHVLNVTGVTGTDGKTSVSQFLAQALNDDDAPCGVIGTLGYGTAGALTAGTHTTPDAVRVQELLEDLRHKGARHVAMEVSSHALDQARVDGVHFRVAVLTNVTRDHLDYHGTEEAYAEAKARLFRRPGLECAVLNLDDRLGRRLQAELQGRVRTLTYSLNRNDSDADLLCTDLKLIPDGMQLSLRIMGTESRLELPLLGYFNAANALATLAALLGLGIPLEQALARMQRLRPVRGRMEKLGGNGKPLVIVDYAHTPAALEAALKAVRGHVQGRLWCVFGCGGDRDTGKRPQMGEIAARLADEVVVTSDNPRGENPQQIIADILAGMESGTATTVVDREQAINHAIARAEPTDAVLIAGKGHEQEQVIGERRFPFDDRAVAAAALEEIA